MTKMPELVAFMHSMIGLAAVFIAVAAVAEPWALERGLARGEAIPYGNRLELFLGAAIGAITFSGSVIAFGKLSGKYKFRLFQGAPVQFPGQHMLNLVLGLAMLGFGLRLRRDRELAGVLRDAGDRLRAGRADHHPDRRRRHAGGGVDAQQLLGLGRGGHRLLAEQRDADHRRLAGGQLGRDPELHHVQGDEPLVLQRDPGRLRRRAGHGGGRRGRGSGRSRAAAPTTRPSSWATPRRVIIVPGYGLAVARAQHAVKELAAKLTAARASP